MVCLLDSVCEDSVEAFPVFTEMMRQKGRAPRLTRYCVAPPSVPNHRSSWSDTCMLDTLLCMRPSFVVIDSNVSPLYRIKPPPHVANHILPQLSSLTSRKSSTMKPLDLVYLIVVFPLYRTAPCEVAIHISAFVATSAALTLSISTGDSWSNSVPRYVFMVSLKINVD